MTKEELIEFIKENLELKSSTSYEYTGEMDGSGNLYKDVHTVDLIFCGETISSIDLG